MPPVTHVVLLNLASPSSTDSLTSAVLSLSTLPGVLSVTANSTFVPAGSPDRTAGYNYAIECKFDSLSSLLSYSSHPLHIKVKTEAIGPALAKVAAPVLAVDWVEEEERGEGGSEEEGRGWKVAAVAGWLTAAALLLSRVQRK